MIKSTLGLHPPKQGGSEQQVHTGEVILLCWSEDEINSVCEIWLEAPVLFTGGSGQGPPNKAQANLGSSGISLVKYSIFKAHLELQPDVSSTMLSNIFTAFKSFLSAWQ